jgi:3-hydroxyisobutyrate dehydrogenase-like beta-hydroxyacid dehydrogenase
MMGATTPRDRIAVLGYGRMGRAMAPHLAAANFEVHVFDPDEQATIAAASGGYETHGSPAEAAASADIVLLMVGYEDEARHAVLGDDGVLAADPKPDVIVMGSTVGAGFIRSLAASSSAAGVGLLDAPVCRGEHAAVDGDLLWLVGGSGADLERCRAALLACGSDVFHLGDVGTGQVAKAINNMLLWTAMCADHEAFDLARAYDVDVETLRTALVTSTGSNWALENWDRMQRIPWALKDMIVTLEIADDAHLSLPLAGIVREQAKVHQWRAGYGTTDG